MLIVRKGTYYRTVLDKLGDILELMREESCKWCLTQVIGLTRLFDG